MSRIDRATQRVIEERVTALGGGAVAPTPFIPTQIREPGSRSGWYESTPGTTNPPASALRFNPAEEAREVAKILRAYADSATGLTPQEGARVLDLDSVFRLADSSSREHRRAEEDFILAVVSLLVERHQWSPRLFNDTSVVLSGDGDNGAFDSAVSVINTLRVTRRLPFGGDVEARWVTRAADELVRASTNAYTSSSEIVLAANIPLLRGAGMVAREGLIQAERETVYAAREYERFRRSLLVSIAADYFNLLETRARIANQIRQLESQERRQAETMAKVEAGRLNLFQNDIVANAVKQSQAQLANLRESYILQLERFKVRLGLEPGTPVVLGDTGLALREPEITPEQAAARALDYRLDLQNRRDRLIDAQRAVANARNDLLPDLNLNASVSVPTDPNGDQEALGLDGGEAGYQAGATFSLPLDRRIEKLGLRRSQIALEQAHRSFEEFRDGIVIAARQAVRAIDLARFQLQLAETQIEINRRGLEDLSLRDDADPQAILDRQNALLDAENARDQAVTALRNAVLQYLLTTGQMRVRPDGTFNAPEGMRTLDPDEDYGQAAPYPEPDDGIDDGAGDEQDAPDDTAPAPPDPAGLPDNTDDADDPSPPR